MTKKIPLRKCIVSGERFPKKELLRIVKNKEGLIYIDGTGKASGRGAYINLTNAAITKAKGRKILNRVFDTAVSDNVYDDLLKYYEEKNS